MAKDIKRAKREEKIRICCREYFISDEIILIDSSMLRVRNLIFLIQNNTYFGNRILFSKKDIEEFKSFKEETNGELVSKNAKEILRLINKYPSDYQIVDIEEGENGIVKFLIQNEEVILYTIQPELKEIVEKHNLRCRMYKKQVKIDKDFPKSVNYSTLTQIHCEGRKNFLKQSKDIKVYDENKVQLTYPKVKLSRNHIILVIERKEDITKCYIYKVVNYHSRRNLIQLGWSDVKNCSQEIKGIPNEYLEIVRKNL